MFVITTSIKLTESVEVKYVLTTVALRYCEMTTHDMQKCWCLPFSCGNAFIV